MINAPAEWLVSPGREEGGCAYLAQSARSVCVCALEGWRVEVAKSGPRGGLQSSTPRLWVAFDVARRLWWPRPWRNAARPPSPPKEPPELWNAAQAAAAAATPAGMGLEHRQPILPCLPSLGSLPPCSLEWTWQQPCPDPKLWENGGKKRRIHSQMPLSLVSPHYLSLAQPLGLKLS